MKFSRIDLLTLLISLFIFSGCKNQNTIGLNTNSIGEISGTLVVDTAIVINTVPEDTVSTTNLAKIPMGYLNDPVFGQTQVDVATDLNLPNSSAYTLPAGTITIDSAILVLHFADGFYGDSVESNYKVNVYQLNKPYNHSITYYNNKKWDVNYSTLLGTLTFNARTHDSVKVNHIIAGFPDTLYKVAPQIRIPISQYFVSSNFFNASSSALSSNSVFQNSIKGLYITIDKTKTTGSGGIFMLKADTLQVYYKSVLGATVDTSLASLPATGTAAAITHNYTPAVNAALANTTSSNGAFYIQGAAGLRAKISFPNLLQNVRNSLSADSDIVLNRAELVITPKPGSTIPFQPLPKLTMYTLDIAKQPTLLEDATTNDPRSGGVGVFGGYYTAAKRNYHFIITAFLQDLLLNRTKDNGTYIAAVDTTNTTAVDYLETPQVAARTIAIGTDKTSPYRIVLNIIYSKIRKTH